MNLKVAIVQNELSWEDRAANLNALAGSMEHLSSEQADLVVLPEMFASGFTMNTGACAEKMDGDSVAWLLSLSKEKGFAIGGSLIVEEGGKFFNRFVFVTPSGSIDTYDKRHLFTMAKEPDFYSAGMDREIWEYKGWKILPQICYDLRFPVFSRNRRVQLEPPAYEYDVAFYVANWPERRSAAWKTLLAARAMENQAFVVGVNRIGSDGNDISYSGDSAVHDPLGEKISTLAQNEMRVEVVELDRELLLSARKKFPILNDGDNFELQY